MKKPLFISLTVLVLTIAAILCLNQYLGKEEYRNIMTLIGCYQVGAWAGQLGDYLGHKYGNK